MRDLERKNSNKEKQYTMYHMSQYHPTKTLMGKN
jgi:hypothetical protein